ncbi:MAG: S8 family serine peptidase [Agriterribacter sp.]
MRDSIQRISLLHKLKYIFLLPLIVVFGCKGCFEQAKKTPDWTSYLSDQKGAVLSSTPEKQLIVFIKPGTSREAFNAFLDTAIVKYKDSALKIISVCGSCDSTLLMLEGSGVEAFINGKVAKGESGSKSEPQISGENDLLYYTSNRRISFDATPDTLSIKEEYQNINYQDSIILAVFDTGVEPDLFQNYLVDNLSNPPCISGATNGWNFYTWSNNWKDDNVGLHGTTVSKFITNEIIRYQTTKVRILPVKVFNAEGFADLYTILCGFAYASHSGANMVNASFGFYESKTKFRNGEPISDTTTTELLKNFISTYLTEKNILLICAAGNKNDDDSTVRNLDEIHFYPASLSATLPNIIPVTTVGNTGNGRVVSPNQNFSPSIVQLGVDCDFIDDDYFGFVNPINPNSNIPVAGSSFASPIAAGKMAAYFNRYKSLLNTAGSMTFATRDSIFNILFTMPGNNFLQTDRSLLQKVNKGKVVVRNTDNAGTKKRNINFVRGIEERGLKIIKR